MFIKHACTYSAYNKTTQHDLQLKFHWGKKMGYNLTLWRKPSMTIGSRTFKWWHWKLFNMWTSQLTHFTESVMVLNFDEILLDSWLWDTISKKESVIEHYTNITRSPRLGKFTVNVYSEFGSVQFELVWDQIRITSFSDQFCLFYSNFSIFSHIVTSLTILG